LQIDYNLVIKLTLGFVIKFHISAVKLRIKVDFYAGKRWLSSCLPIKGKSNIPTHLRLSWLIFCRALPTAMPCVLRKRRTPS